MNKSYSHLTLDKQTKNILSGTKKYKRENITIKMNFKNVFINPDLLCKRY